MTDRNFNSSMQLPDANSEVGIEAIVPYVEMNQKAADAAWIMENKMEKISPPQNHPFIYRVHKKLRDVNEKAYEPVVLAIGPYHRGKKHLKMMEEHKWRYLKALLVRRPDMNFKYYVSAIEHLEQDARCCYAEPLDDITSAEFIEMLVLDGCFIIELLEYYISENTVGDPIFQTLWIKDSLARDMLLFENQIPFFVLCRLFDLIAPNQLDRLIYLVLFFIRRCFPGANTTNISSISHDAKLFGQITRPISHFIKKHWINGSSQDAKDEHDLLRNYERSENQYILHILDLVHSNWSRKSNNDDHANSTQPQGGFQFIPSATDLRDANVKFRLSSEHNTLFDVVFDKGTLSIPPLIIANQTETILRNLIVYEQFFPASRPTNFTAYAWFLDCLINSSADVTLLSQRGIIQYFMGDNEVVAKIFNEITNSTRFRLHFAYANTFHLINAYSNRKKNRAIANLKRNYFNSPWAYISFFAGLLLLSLTIAQTVLSALQLG